jgi:transcriptional regulator CtsR
MRTGCFGRLWARVLDFFDARRELRRLRANINDRVYVVTCTKRGGDGGIEIVAVHDNAHKANAWLAVHLGQSESRDRGTKRYSDLMDEYSILEAEFIRHDLR